MFSCNEQYSHPHTSKCPQLNQSDAWCLSSSWVYSSPVHYGSRHPHVLHLCLFVHLWYPSSIAGPCSPGHQSLCHLIQLWWESRVPDPNLHSPLRGPAEIRWPLQNNYDRQHAPRRTPSPKLGMWGECGCPLKWNKDTTTFKTEEVCPLTKMRFSY